MSDSIRRLKDFRSTLYVEIYKDFIFLMTPYFFKQYVAYGRRLKDFRSTLYVEIYKDFFLMTPYFLNNMLLMADIPKCCHTTPKTLKNRHFSEMSY